jgi:hypothetical protein
MRARRRSAAARTALLSLTFLVIEPHATPEQALAALWALGLALALLGHESALDSLLAAVPGCRVFRAPDKPAVPNAQAKPAHERTGGGLIEAVAPVSAKDTLSKQTASSLNTSQNDPNNATSPSTSQSASNQEARHRRSNRARAQ